jgi:membrane protease YdiL (CAAX protease family)
LAVLLAGPALCFLIIWGGEHIAALAIQSISTVGAESTLLNESVATLIIFGPLLLAGLAGGALCGINAARPGAGFRGLAAGAGIGFIGLVIATFLAAIAGALRQQHGGLSVGLLGGGSALIMLQAGSEEIFFRGWVQPVLVKGWGAAGIVVTALAFALVHRIESTTSVVSLFNMFLGGLLFGALAARYNGIAAAFGAHFSWNWAEQLVFGLDPNPGAGNFGSIFNFDLVGSPWWGGSNEGLNASIAMTFALATLLVPILFVRATIQRPPEPRRSDRARD